MEQSGTLDTKSKSTESVLNEINQKFLDNLQKTNNTRNLQFKKKFIKFNEDKMKLEKLIKHNTISFQNNKVKSVNIEIEFLKEFLKSVSETLKIYSRESTTKKKVLEWLKNCRFELLAEKEIVVKTLNYGKQKQKILELTLDEKQIEIFRLQALLSQQKIKNDFLRSKIDRKHTLNQANVVERKEKKNEKELSDKSWDETKGYLSGHTPPKDDTESTGKSEKSEDSGITINSQGSANI